MTITALILRPPMSEPLGMSWKGLWIKENLGLLKKSSETSPRIAVTQCCYKTKHPSSDRAKGSACECCPPSPSPLDHHLQAPGTPNATQPGAKNFL